MSKSFQIVVECYGRMLMTGKVRSLRDKARDDQIKMIINGGSLKIYEASAGSGELAADLQEDGHDVVVSNFRKGNVRYELIEHEVDLNRSLPFASESLDVIICREVIEHIESIPGTLREFWRCLRPGGAGLEFSK